MVDIFDEVDEELRADRTQAFLRRHGANLVAAAFLIVAAVGGWEFWQGRKIRQELAVAQEYIVAMLQAQALPPSATPEQRQGAAKNFNALAGKGDEGYRTLSRLWAAALDADAGQLRDAVTTYDQVAADSAADPLLRDLATLLWARRQVDVGDPGLIEARLRTLTGPDNPWHALARETEGLLLLRKGEMDAARASFKQVAEDPDAPKTLQARAQAMLARLGG